jgi:hypothetical protein
LAPLSVRARVRRFSGQPVCTRRSSCAQRVTSGAHAGIACDKAARHVTSLSYYTSIFLALIAPAVALLPAMYSLYLDRYSDALLFIAASAMGLAMLLSDLFALPSGPAVCVHVCM